MRFIVEPSHPEKWTTAPPAKVTIETQSDMLNIEEVGETLKLLVLAMGFHPELVEAVFAPMVVVNDAWKRPSERGEVG